jgi:cyclase
LDIKDGRVVKGVRFADLRDAGDPVELVRRYDQDGADEVVFYDISASAEGRRTMLEVVTATAEHAFIPLTVGGGVSDTEWMRTLLRAGADKVSINTAAVADPDLISAGALRFGSQCIVLSMDVRRAGPGRWEVVTHGGRRPTGRDAVAWAVEGERRGAGEIVVNSIDADGVRRGYDVALVRAVADAVGVPVVASGGAGSPEDMCAVLTEGRADAALAASIFHSGEVTVADVKAYLSGRGVRVRTV